MPLVDLVDESFVHADPAVVARRLADPGVLRRFWPGLRLVVFQDRGPEGVRWTVTGALVGTAEVWLERFSDGVIVHSYLRADPTASGSETEPRRGRPARLDRTAFRVRRRYATGLKAAVWSLKDELEAGRPVGTPRGSGSGPGPVQPGS